MSWNFTIQIFLYETSGLMKTKLYHVYVQFNGRLMDNLYLYKRLTLLITQNTIERKNFSLLIHYSFSYNKKIYLVQDGAPLMTVSSFSWFF